MKLIPFLLMFLGGCTICCQDDYYWQEIKKCHQAVYEAQSARMLAEAQLASMAQDEEKRSQVWLDAYYDAMEISHYAIEVFKREMDSNESER